MLSAFERAYRPPCFFFFTVFLHYSIIFFCHHSRHQTTCFSNFRYVGCNFSTTCALRRLNRNSQQSIYQYSCSVLCFAFISPSSCPAIAAVHYITHQLFYHLQPTTALCSPASLSCPQSSPCRLTTILLSHPARI